MTAPELPQSSQNAPVNSSETTHQKGGSWFLTPGLALSMVAAVVAAFAIKRAFVLAHRTLGWIVACAIIALIIDQVVSFLSRYVPRALAIVATVLGVVGIVVGMILQISRELKSSLGALATVGIQAAQKLEASSEAAKDLRVSATMKVLIANLTTALNPDPTRNIQAAPTYFVTGILMLFLLVSGRKYVLSAIAQIPGAAQQQRVQTIVSEAIRRSRLRLSYASIQIVVTTIAGTAVFTLLDMQAALILASLIGIGTILPFVGVPIAAIPAFLVAYSRSGGFGFACVSVFVIALLTADEKWRRHCNRRAVRTGLFFPTVALVIGDQLYGIGGATYGYALTVIGLGIVAAANLDGDNNITTW